MDVSQIDFCLDAKLHINYWWVVKYNIILKIEREYMLYDIIDFLHYIIISDHDIQWYGVTRTWCRPRKYLRNKIDGCILLYSRCALPHHKTFNNIVQELENYP